LADRQDRRAVAGADLRPAHESSRVPRPSGRPGWGRRQNVVYGTARIKRPARADAQGSAEGAALPEPRGRAHQEAQRAEQAVVIAQAEGSGREDGGADHRLDLVQFGAQSDVLLVQVGDGQVVAIQLVVTDRSNRAGCLGHGRFPGGSRSGSPCGTPPEGFLLCGTPPKKSPPLASAGEGEWREGGTV